MTNGYSQGCSSGSGHRFVSANSHNYVIPDPVGSGTFSWIRNFFLDPDPNLLISDPAKMKDQVNNNYSIANSGCRDQPRFSLVRHLL